MSDIALVTGASGFVGSAVARALVARGLKVRVLMRASASRLNIASLDCEPVTGDMRDQASITGCGRAIPVRSNATISSGRRPPWEQP